MAPKSSITSTESLGAITSQTIIEWLEQMEKAAADVASAETAFENAKVDLSQSYKPQETTMGSADGASRQVNRHTEDLKLGPVMEGICKTLEQERREELKDIMESWDKMSDATRKMRGSINVVIKTAKDLDEAVGRLYDLVDGMLETVRADGLWTAGQKSGEDDLNQSEPC